MSKKVKIAIEKMHCIRPTENGWINDRDELYIAVAGKTPAGSLKKRLPRNDDYYEFWEGTRGEKRGWTNQNQRKQGKPVIWEGELENGESADFLINIGEQDNKNLPIFKKIGQKILEYLSKASEENNEDKYGMYITSAKYLIDFLPASDKDDIIGTFLMRVKNYGGRISVTYDDLLHMKLFPRHPEAQSVGNLASYFECHGTSRSHYNLVVNVEAEITIGKKLDPNQKLILMDKLKKVIMAPATIDPQVLPKS